LYFVRQDQTCEDGGEHSLTEIARLSSLPISTAHRLTAELGLWHLLERTEMSGYAPPTAAHRRHGRQLSAQPGGAWSVVAGRPGRHNRCRVRLGVLDGLEVSYIEKLPGGKPTSSFAPGVTLPAPPTAIGRALLAFSSGRTVEMAIARGLQQYTAHTVTIASRSLSPRTGRGRAADLRGPEERTRIVTIMPMTVPPIGKKMPDIAVRTNVRRRWRS
jgi:DNA-binding IclR family transcriptional regulator